MFSSDRIKTTIAGLAAIATALANAFFEYKTGGIAGVNWSILVTAIVAGVGLIFALDAPKPGATP